ncbi:MAG: hypothetical protein JO199_08860 [Candidatus Eremiobacteraeota bacterium]|nr:hypothetical protein [Candidatus Eremiobacteraeota bacterium]
MRFVFVLCALALAAAPLVSRAAAPPSPAASPAPNNGFYAVNSGDKALGFSYGCDGKAAMSNATLAAKAGAWYSLPGCQKYEITITTFVAGEPESVIAEADAGNKYEFVWDTNRNIWNFNPAP